MPALLLRPLCIHSPAWCTAIAFPTGRLSAPRFKSKPSKIGRLRCGHLLSTGRLLIRRRLGSEGTCQTWKFSTSFFVSFKLCCWPEERIKEEFFWRTRIRVTPLGWKWSCQWSCLWNKIFCSNTTLLPRREFPKLATIFSVSSVLECNWAFFIASW